MPETPIRDDAAHIYCTAETRDRFRNLKRGGETYDELLRRVVEQYDPDSARDKEGVHGGN
ncbi:hypothetical protein ACLI4Q_03880 [Natrialbaceae archaeon A-CW1-1]